MEQDVESVGLINQRLVSVRQALDLNQQDFSELIKVSRSYLSNIEKGRREVPLAVMSLLIGAKQVSAHWLMTGEGGMFSPSPNPSPIQSQSEKDKTKGTNFEEVPARREKETPPEKLRVLVTTVDSAGRDNIALVSTRVAAGYTHGGFVEREFIRELPTFSLPGAAYRNGTFRAFQVAGDSMQPVLYDGDWVICRFVDKWANECNERDVHVVVTEERLLVKRLINRLNENGQLTLLSDNSAYPTQFLDGEDIREVWVAVARLSREFINPRFDLVEEVRRTRADVDELLGRINSLERANRATSAV